MNLREVPDLYCVHLDLPPVNVAAPLDVDPALITAFVERARAEMDELIDWAQGFVVQVDPLEALLDQRYTEVRQTVCLPLKAGARPPESYAVMTFPPATVLEFRAAPGQGASSIMAHALGQALQWTNPAEQRVLGAFVRTHYLSAADGSMQSVVRVETLPPFDA